MTLPGDRAPGGQPTSDDRSNPMASSSDPSRSSSPPVWGAPAGPDDAYHAAASVPPASGPDAGVDEPAVGRRFGRPRLGRPHLGRPRLTPLRVFLGVALIGCLGLVAYGLVARDATQIPVLTAGEFVTGIVFALLALAGAWAAFSRARRGQSGKALVYALLGGVAALLSASAFAGAVIQALILTV